MSHIKKSVELYRDLMTAFHINNIILNQYDAIIKIVPGEECSR